jgi:hypothetical protein
MPITFLKRRPIVTPPLLNDAASFLVLSLFSEAAECNVMQSRRFPFCHCREAAQQLLQR